MSNRRPVLTPNDARPMVNKAPIEPCLTCGGRGVISSGTDDVKCEACSGTGKQK